MLNESWSVGKKDKSCVGGLTGGGSGTARGGGYSAVSNLKYTNYYSTLIFNHSCNIQYVRKELFGDETNFYIFKVLHDRKSIQQLFHFARA